jgi:D-threo-aldose 1-dehydrogenase
VNRIGGTCVEVSPVGFGGAPIGNLYAPVDDETARAAVDAAWDGGVRYFDTAPHYGLGLSERRLGAALRDRPRAQYTLSTKVGRLLVDNPAPSGSDLAAGGFAVPDRLRRARDYTRDGVLRSLAASLDRLGTDRIDIGYLHDPEQHMTEALGQAVPALIELREQGVVGAVGAGMNFADPLLRVVRETDVDVVMLAGRWTLADRRGEALLAACAERGVSVACAAPFNSGLLAADCPEDGERFDYGPAPADVLDFARRLGAVCRAAGTTLPQAAMQFPARHPAVATVVVGMRTADQVRADLAWAGDPVPPGLWHALAELDPDRPRSLTG